MRRERLRLYSYHSFLFVPFIVLFLFAHNAPAVTIGMIWRPLLIGTACSLLLFGLCYPLLKNRLKTGIFVTCFLFISFQYGVLYEFLESLYYAGKWPLKNIHRYLVGFYVLLLLTVFFLLRFSRREFIRANYFLNVMVVLLLVFNVTRLLFTMPESGVDEERTVNTETGLQLTGNRRPNIYHIVLDGYASARTLQQHYGYSNAQFLNALKATGFSVADSAFANYFYTDKSLNSMLNMQLMPDDANDPQTIANNKVMRALKSAGYNICTLNSGYAVTSNFDLADTKVAIEGPNEFEKSVLRHTILRLDDLVGFFSRKRLESQFRRMYLLPEAGAEPRYAFLHFVAPHPPFVFDSLGKMRARHNFAGHGWEPKEKYLGQLVYTNKMILPFVEQIRKNDPEAMILLHSDHGPWLTAASADSIFAARAGILYSWYAPVPLHIPQKTSPVNLFRYVFNGVFGAELPIVPDEQAGREALLADPILLKKVATEGIH